MAYGMSMWQEPELQFPALMDSAHIDAIIEPEKPVKLPRFRPMLVIRRYSRPLAGQLESLWGYPGFCKFIDSIAARARAEGLTVPADLLKALLALAAYHAEHIDDLEDIDVSVVDLSAAMGKRAA